jgi:hypothetical protein
MRNDVSVYDELSGYRVTGAFWFIGPFLHYLSFSKGIPASLCLRFLSHPSPLYVLPATPHIRGRSLEIFHVPVSGADTKAHKNVCL